MGKKQNGENGAPKREIRVEHFTQNLRVILAPAEIADRADRAAQVIADHDAKEAEQAAAAKHAKSVLASLSAEHRRLSNEVRTKSTYRDVPCERRFDFVSGTISEHRIDTGEVVFERSMTEAEKQAEFDFGKGGPGGDLGDDFGDEASL